MRVVYKIVLGLLLFNAFLTLFAPIFNTAASTSYSENAVNYSSTDMTNYTITNVSSMIGLIFNEANYGALGTASVIIAAAVIAAFATKSYVLIGVGLFVSIVIGLYVKMSSIIANIGNQTNNIYVTGIIVIVGIAIGVLIVFNVVDMFAPASARE